MKKPHLLFILLFVFSFTMLQAQDSVMVTFKVNMKIQMERAYHTTDDTASVNGSFQGWTPLTNILTKGATDSIFTGTFKIEAGSNIEYKFYSSNDIVPNNWESVDNRSATIGSNDTTLALVMFNNYVLPVNDSTEFTAKVDMNVRQKEGKFDPAAEDVFVTGDFHGWDHLRYKLSDDDNDLIYEGTFKTPTKKIVHKFMYTPKGATNIDNAKWEDLPDQPFYMLDDAANNVIERTFGREVLTVDGKDGSIIFNVDATPLIEMNLYNEVTDTLQVRGAFNGWNDSEKSKTILTQNFINPTQYFIEVPFVNTEVGKSQTYKYFIKVADQENSPLKGDAGYERPNSTLGANRETPFQGVDDQQVEVVYFNDAHPDLVIPDGTKETFRFKVDMRPAMKLFSDPFVPGEGKVYVRLSQALFAATQGYTEGEDTVAALELTDVDNDSVYTGTFEINGPSFNGMMYIYQYTFMNEGTKGIQTEEESAGTACYRVRFIPMTAARTFAQTYEAKMDTWTDELVKTDQSETNPDGYVVSVDEIIDNTPQTFSLEQNYPNPFNPSTKIKFTTPENGKVELTVFNVLGEKVETIINSEMNAGTYVVDFNAAKLSSGVYFYMLKAGKFVKTNKMIVLR